MKTAMGKIITIITLIIAAYAIDAYAFGGRYRETAIQQGKLFSWEVQYQLKKIGKERQTAKTFLTWIK